MAEDNIDPNADVSDEFAHFDPLQETKVTERVRMSIVIEAHLHRMSRLAVLPQNEKLAEAFISSVEYLEMILFPYAVTDKWFQEETKKLNRWKQNQDRVGMESSHVALHDKIGMENLIVMTKWKLRLLMHLMERHNLLPRRRL